MYLETQDIAELCIFHVTRALNIFRKISEFYEEEAAKCNYLMGRAFTSKMTNSKIQEVDKTNPEACEETRKTS